MVAHSTFGRLVHDDGKLSDPLSIINLVTSFLLINQGKEKDIIEKGYILSLFNFYYANSLACSPNFLKELDKSENRYISSNDSAKWCIYYGISQDRLWTLLKTVGEIALRLIRSLPHCRTQLIALASITRLKKTKSLRTHSMSLVFYYFLFSS